MMGKPDTRQDEVAASLRFTSYNPSMSPWGNSNGPLIVANFKSTSVPEPATLALMGNCAGRSGIFPEKYPH